MYTIIFTPRRVMACPGVFGAKSPWGARVQSLMISFMTGWTTGTPVTPHRASSTFFPNNGAPCEVPRSTLARWLEHYGWWGETPAQTRAQKRCLSPGKVNARAVGVTVRNFIKTLLTDNPHLYLDEIRDRVRVAGHGHWSISTIHHVITHRSQLNWSLTKITFKAMQADPYEQLVYRAALSTIDDPAMLVFVDESSVGKKACRRRRGWSPRGTTATGLEFFTGTDATSGSTYTLIAAADINGFVEAACQAVWRKRSSTDRNLLAALLMLLSSRNGFAPCLCLP